MARSAEFWSSWFWVTMGGGNGKGNGNYYNGVI